MPIIVKTKKILVNPLLSRKQMVIDVIHPGVANVSRKDLQETISKKMKVDQKYVVVFGMKTKFGGGRSTGFALIYDN